MITEKLIIAFVRIMDVISESRTLRKLVLAIPCCMMLAIIGLGAVVTFPHDQGQAITLDVLTLFLAACFTKTIMQQK